MTVPADWGRAITRKEIVAAARSWIGTPYRHLGRDRKHIDCIGFVWCVPKEMGLPGVPVIPTKYTTFPAEDMLKTEADAKLRYPADRQGLANVKPGDIMMMWGWERQVAQHFAIAGEDAGRLTMIHAFAKRNQVVEHSIDEFWTKRYVATYEYPGTVD